MDRTWKPKTNNNKNYVNFLFGLIKSAYTENLKNMSVTITISSSRKL
jgi:hypothetical protein